MLLLAVVFTCDFVSLNLLYPGAGHGKSIIDRCD